MNATLIFLVGIVGAVGTFLAGVAAYRKWAPESRKINVETIDLNVNIAGRLRDDAIDSWERAREERDALAKRVNDLTVRVEAFEAMAARAEKRAEIAETRASDAEGRVRTLTAENAGLRDRVVHLEAEVATLKGGRS